MLYPKFKKTILKNNLIAEGDTILLGVSGGIDSMVMLDLLHRLKDSMHLDLHVAHVNYGLRGRDSIKDEDLVKGVCDSYGTRCSVLRRKPRAGMNLQNSAREIRMNFFAKLSSGYDSSTLLLAHNMEDQAETVLLHMLRGAGIEGMSGMQMRSVSGLMRIVRPLIGVSRAEIAAYAKERKISFREDRTNKSSKYARNDIRHNLLPALRRINSSAISMIYEMSNRLSADGEALRVIASQAFEFSTAPSKDGVTMERKYYVGLPYAVRVRLLQMAFERVNGSKKDLSSDHIEKMDHISISENGKGSYRLPSSCKFQREGGVISLFRSGTTHDR